MAINRIDYVTSITASTAPTPGTPSASSDVLTKGYADSYLANKTSWYDKCANITAVKAIASADRSDGQVVFNYGTNVFYRFNAGSSATGDDDLILTPSSGTGRWEKVTSGSGSGTGDALVQQLDGTVSTILAGEALSALDVVAMEVHGNADGSGNSGFLYFKADDDNYTRRSILGVAKSAVSGTAGVYTYTIDSAYVSGNTIPITINGRSYSTTYASSSDATLQALATAIGADPDIKTATVTVVGGNQTGTDDRVITITASNGINGGTGYVSLTFTGTTITGGASQPTVTMATSTAPVRNSVDVHQFGPLAGWTSLTPGADYFLSTTAGSYTLNPTTGNARYIGRALSSTVMFVDPSGVYSKQFGSNGIFVKSHGEATYNTLSSVSGGSEFYNFSAWSTGTSSGAARGRMCLGGQGEYNGKHHTLDGYDSGGGGVVALFTNFDRSSWSTLTNRGTAKDVGGCSAFNGFLYGNTGRNGGSVYDHADKWNTSSWSSGAAWGTAAYFTCEFTQNALLRVVGGKNSGGGDIATHQTRTTADSVSTSTSAPASDNSQTSGIANSTSGFIGNVNVNAPGNTTYVWSGSWSAGITNQYSRQVAMAAGHPTNGLSIIAGGNDASSTASSAEKYNGVSFTTITASNTARTGGKASII